MTINHINMTDSFYLTQVSIQQEAQKEPEYKIQHTEVSKKPKLEVRDSKIDEEITRKMEDFDNEGLKQSNHFKMLQKRVEQAN